MKKIRIGLVGAGWMGKAHSSAIKTCSLFLIPCSLKGKFSSTTPILTWWTLLRPTPSTIKLQKPRLRQAKMFTAKSRCPFPPPRLAASY